MAAPDPAQTRVQITRMLGDLLRGDAAAAERVLPLIYAELRALAGVVARDANERSDFQPTELIHEAYLRLVDVDPDRVREVENRLHFKRLAARAMHSVLVDRARVSRSAKRGGAQQPATLHEDAVAGGDDATVIEVHQALEALRRMDPRLADVVEMRFFAGMSIQEVAGALRVSERTVHRDWRLARAWWLSEHPEDRPNTGSTER